LKNSSSVAIIGVVVAVLLCCCCLVGLAVLGGFTFLKRTVTQPFFNPSIPFNIPTLEGGVPTLPGLQNLPTLSPNILPTVPGLQIPGLPTLPSLFGQETPTPPDGATPEPTPGIITAPLSQEAISSLHTLQTTNITLNDPNVMAQRFRGVGTIPATYPDPGAPFAVGATHEFWASNTDDNSNFRVKATLRYVGAHVYIWIEDGIQFNQSAVNKLASTFDTQIYPKDREFFGSEWTPGIDADPHLYILYAHGLGSTTAGYFSSADELSPLANKYSNAHEMFMINSDGVDLSEQYIYSTMAHEFQHMIHWYEHRNDESWLNEGFSVLAELLNGYPIGGFDTLFAQNPDMQLNDWSSDQTADRPHYGASFLFADYFLSRFGEKATQLVVSSKGRGLGAFDDALTQLNVKDTTSGKTYTTEDLFADWAVTNYILDGKAGDGRFTYTNYAAAPKVKPTEIYNNCPVTNQVRMVHQFGSDYIRFTCKGTYTLKFTGSTEARLLPVDAHSGKLAFWSNKDDQADMTLTHTFDFSQVSGPIGMTYYTWYDLEKDFDYVYLVASEDGTKWEMVKTPSCNATDPTGQNYGCGYNASSSGWIKEDVDLSQYAGKKVQLRFEYITDQAVNWEGFLVDDISIPAINYTTDFEKDDGGWEANGFVRVENRLPQDFAVSLVSKGQKTIVERLALPSDQTISVPITIGNDVSEVTLVVSGVTRFTRQPANYGFSMTK
jgi:immune inhibitor A